MEIPTNETDEMVEGEPEGTPLDSIIARVESYIADPKMVTPETLAELRDELVDFKSFMEGGGEEEMEKPEAKGRGLSAIIGGEK